MVRGRGGIQSRVRDSTSNSNIMFPGIGGMGVGRGVGGSSQRDGSMGVGRGVGGISKRDGKQLMSNDRAQNLDNMLDAGCMGVGRGVNVTSKRDGAMGAERGICGSSQRGGKKLTCNARVQKQGIKDLGAGRGACVSGPLIGRGINVTSASGDRISNSWNKQARILDNNRQAPRVNSELLPSVENVFENMIAPRVNSERPPSMENVFEDMTNPPESESPNSISRKRNVRGLTKGVNAPNAGELKMLVVVLRKTLSPIQARTKIGTLFRNHFTECRTKWIMWKNKLDLLWADYLRYFRFETPEEEKRGRIVWEYLAAKNYPNYLYRWKEDAVKKHGSIEVARNHKPKWTTDSVWKELCDYWTGKVFQKASALRQKNRSAKKGIPHATGNHAFEEINEKLTTALGRPPTQWELFNETHLTKRGGGTEREFITEDAKKFSETYASQLREANGLEPTAPVNGVKDPELKIYEKAVGGVQKGRLSGRPGERWSKRDGHVSSLNFAEQVAMQQSSQEVKMLKVAVAENARINAENAKINAENAKINSDQNAFLQSLYKYIEDRAAENGHPPPPRAPSFIMRAPNSDGASNNPYGSSTNLIDDDEQGQMGDEQMGQMGDENMGDEHMGEDYY